MIDATSCYRALRARDGRFDGLFFVGVRTTGIYCRPICPARTPAVERCEFFERAAAAERAGYRACFRCRPELAPGSANVDSVSRLARTAAAKIDEGYLNSHSLDELAAGLGVTARHVRRTLEREIGISPVELAQTRRLAVAKQLLHETRWPLGEVALAAGYSSLRRFNAQFLERFGCAPSTLRRGRQSASLNDEPLDLRLDYRPPLDWEGLLAFLAARAIPGVEAIEGDEYRRTLVIGDRTGWIAVRPERGHLRARVALSLRPRLIEVVSRVRAAFDLDASPDAVARVLETEPLLATSVAARPGLRVPGSLCGFETAIRAVLGQQVSVVAARTLAQRLVERFGQTMDEPRDGLTRFFPRPSELAAVSLDAIRAVGMPCTRAQTLLGVAKAAHDGGLDLTPSADPVTTRVTLRAIPGVGPWTADYIAMRALRLPDAFPSSDLGVLRRLGLTNARDAERRAEAWRPWRAYAVLHLWQSTPTGG